MDETTRDVILGTSKELVSNYVRQNILDTSLKPNLPDTKVVYSIIDDLLKITFPGYFGTEKYLSGEAFAEGILVSLYEKLRKQIRISLINLVEREVLKERAEDLTNAFMRKIPQVQEMLMKDVEAQFIGDPAARSKEEIILAYPGLYTIFVYRYAHILYELKVPMLPRIMSEYAHSRTGVEYSPGVLNYQRKTDSEEGNDNGK